MHKQRSRTFRTVCWLFALLQLGFPLASAVADAHALGARASDRVHLESERCAPSHPADCAHCAGWRDAAPAADVVHLAFFAGAVKDVSPVDPARRAPAFVASSPLPRAPPALS